MEGHRVRVEPALLDTSWEAEELLIRFFAEEDFPMPPEGLAERVRQYLSLPHHAVFLAREGSASVGVATVTANFGIEYAWAAELEDLYVVPEHRGRGIARLLIEECEAWARRQGCSSVLVTVTREGQHRHDLVGLYRHLGFADRGRKLLELGLDEE